MISSSQRPLPDNTQHSQQTSMPPTEFEPTIPASGRPQTYALDRAATGTGHSHIGYPTFILALGPEIFHTGPTKGKVFLCPRHEDVRGKGCTFPLFLNSALDAGEWSASRPLRCVPEQSVHRATATIISFRTYYTTLIVFVVQVPRGTESCCPGFGEAPYILFQGWGRKRMC